MLTNCPIDHNDSSQPPRDICQFAPQPFSECHCHAITSVKVPMALYFCGGHYQECSIYKQHLDSAGDGTLKKLDNDLVALEKAPGDTV